MMDMDEEEDIIKHVTALWFWSMTLTSKVFTIWHRYTIYKKKKLFAQGRNGSLDCMDSVDEIIAGHNYFDKILSIGNLIMESNKKNHFNTDSQCKSEDNLFNLFHDSFDYDDSEMDIKENGKGDETCKGKASLYMQESKGVQTDHNFLHVETYEENDEESKDMSPISVYGLIERTGEPTSHQVKCNGVCKNQDNNSHEIVDYESDKVDTENSDYKKVDEDDDNNDHNDIKQCVDDCVSEQENYYIETSASNESSDDDEEEEDENYIIQHRNANNLIDDDCNTIKGKHADEDGDNVDETENNDDDDDDDDDATNNEVSVDKSCSGSIMVTSSSVIDHQLVDRSHELVTELIDVESLNNIHIEQKMPRSANEPNSNGADLSKAIVSRELHDNSTQTDQSFVVSLPPEPQTPTKETIAASHLHETTSGKIHDDGINSMELIPPIAFIMTTGRAGDMKSGFENRTFLRHTDSQYVEPKFTSRDVCNAIFQIRHAAQDSEFVLSNKSVKENFGKILHTTEARHGPYIDYVIDYHNESDDESSNVKLFSSKVKDFQAHFYVPKFIALTRSSNNNHRFDPKIELDNITSKKSTSHDHPANRKRFNNDTQQPIKMISRNLNKTETPSLVFDKYSDSLNDDDDDDNDDDDKYINADDYIKELENIRDKLKQFQDLKNKLKNAMDTKEEIIEMMTSKSFDATPLNMKLFLQNLDKEISELTTFYCNNEQTSIQLAKRAKYLVSKISIK